MRVPLLGLALLASLLTAGCSFGRGGESSDDGLDKEAYTGGRGVAIALANEAQSPFDVTLVVRAVDGSEVARWADTLDPGRSLERWTDVDEQGAYDVRMSYTWSSAVRTSSGWDDESVLASGCPAVTRLAWSFQQEGEQVGHRFESRSCIDEQA